jgi:hypothetical protein
VLSFGINCFFYGDGSPIPANLHNINEKYLKKGHKKREAIIASLFYRYPSFYRAKPTEKERTLLFCFTEP